MKKNKRNYTDQKNLIAILVAIVSILPLSTLLLNTLSIRDIFVFDLYSGFSLRLSYTSIVLSYLLYILYRIIYSTKNTQLFLQISITNFIGNLLHMTILVISMLSLYFKYSAESLSSNSGVLIACILLTPIIQTGIFEVELFASKVKSGSKSIIQTISTKAAPTSIILNTILISAIAVLAYLSPNLRIETLGCIAILTWNLFYVILFRRTVLPQLS